jgi:hypothetical protein
VAAAEGWNAASNLSAGTLTINKANPVITEWPTAAAINSGEKLSASTLIGGESPVEGKFAWTNHDIIPPAGTNLYEVTFTPINTNYNTVTQTISITVNNAVITIHFWVNEQDGTIQHDGEDVISPITISENQTLTLAWQGIDETPDKIPRWYVGGSEIGAGASITISAKNYNAGTYQLMVMVYKNGKPYSAAISFIVAGK